MTEDGHEPEQRYGTRDDQVDIETDAAVDAGRSARPQDLRVVDASRDRRRHALS